MKSSASVLLVLMFCIVSCGQGDFVKLNKDFALWATDDRADMSLCYLDFGKYYVGVVGPCIYAAGYDDKFIMLKMHPTTTEGINHKVTLYYILPLKDSISSVEEAREKIIGPLTALEFEEEKQKLTVSSSLDFDIVFSDLE